MRISVSLSQSSDLYVFNICVIDMTVFALETNKTEQTEQKSNLFGARWVYNTIFTYSCLHNYNLMFAAHVSGE